MKGTVYTGKCQVDTVARYCDLLLKAFKST